MATCNNCKNELSPGTKFCDNCGTQTSPIAPTPTPDPTINSSQANPETSSPAALDPTVQIISSSTPSQDMPYQGMPQQGMPQQGMPQQGMPQQGMPQQGMPQQGMSYQGMPQQGMPQQGMPYQGMPQQGMPYQGMPQQGMPQQGMPQQGMPQQGMPQQGMPYQGMPQQGMPQQGMPIQTDNPVQNQYAHGNTKTAIKQKNTKPVIFIGIGVTALIIIVLAVVLFSSIFSGSNDPAHVGLWRATDVTMLGITIDPNEMYTGGITLELKNNNDCTLSFDGDDFYAEYEIDGSDFKLIQGVEEYPGTIEDNELVITNLLNMGLDIIFTKDTSTGNDAAETEGNGGGTLTNDFDPFVAPGYGAEQTVYSETLEFPSRWYGIVTISNFVGDNDISGEYEAWGYLGEDEKGSYFELYAGAPVDDDNKIQLISFNVDVHDYTFFPIEDDHDWLYGGAPYTESGENWLIPSMLNGTLQATYEYDYEGTSFTLSYNIAKISSVASSDSSTATEAQSNTNAGTISPSGTLTGADLRIIYDILKTEDKELLYPLTIEELTNQYFYGIAPEIDSENDESIAYVWISEEDSRTRVYVTYKPDEDTGIFIYSHATGSELPDA